MTLTLELSADLQKVLEARAQARGLTLPKYLIDLAERDVRTSALAGAQVLEAPVNGESKTASMLATLGRYSTRAEMGLEPSPTDDVANLYVEREDASS